jgi:hypothetical protein
VNSRMGNCLEIYQSCYHVIVKGPKVMQCAFPGRNGKSLSITVLNSRTGWKVLKVSVAHARTGGSS